MAFDVLDAIPLGALIKVDLGQDSRACLPCPLVMREDIRHVHQHPVDDVRHRRPLRRLLAPFAMFLRGLVVGGWSGEHDEPVTRLHLSVTQPAFWGHHAHSLLESERIGKPIHRFWTVLVGDHRNHGWVVRHGFLLESGGRRLGERFGGPGGPDAKAPASTRGSAYLLGPPHRRAGLLTERAQAATTQTGRLGPEDPSSSSVRHSQEISGGRYSPHTLRSTAQHPPMVT